MVLDEQRAGLGVERAGRVRTQQQAADGQQDVAQRQVRAPVALERVDAHGARGAVDVWVKDLGAEVRRGGGSAG